MKPWTENLIKSALKGILAWASYSLLFSKLKKGVFDLLDRTREQADFIKTRMTPVLIDKATDTAKSIRFGYLKTDTGAEELEQLSEEVNMKEEKKKKWSFFKVILVIGILIAIAIFILDRILPKPYEDDDLDDAWAGGDDDFGFDEDEDIEAERPPTADIAYDVNEEDKEEEIEEKAEEEAREEETEKAAEKGKAKKKTKSK